MGVYTVHRIGFNESSRDGDRIDYKSTLYSRKKKV